MSNDNPPENPQEAAHTDDDSHTGAVLEVDDHPANDDEQAQAPAAGSVEAAPNNEISEPAQVTTSHEASPSGQRVTRRTVKRRETSETIEEDIAETVTEDIPPTAYQAPVSDHPRPVG